MITKIDSNNKSCGLGDVICTLPYVELYRQQTGNEVWFDTKHSIESLVKNTYPHIKFGSPQVYDECKIIQFFPEIPMRRSVTNVLGMDYIELDPKVDVNIGPRHIKQKYVTLSIHSTHQGRYWNYRDGWNILVKELKSKYKLSVVCIDKHLVFGNKKNMNEIPNNVIDRCGIELHDAINYMYHSEFHIGLSSGLSWLAHAVGKPVVVMKSVTEDWFEFTKNMICVNNENVCHGCINNVPGTIDRLDDWMLCPVHQNTDRIFECSKSITPRMFLDKMKPLLTYG